MLKSNSAFNKNPYLYTTLATLGYIIAISIVKYLVGQKVILTDVLLGAVIFWVIFFFVHRWRLKRIEKKKSKK